MKDNIMVSVICAAYNHERFIKHCIEGVLNQKTNFKYELIIHDDASTDRTAEIIKEYEERYPEIMRPIYQKENQFFRCPIAAFVFPKAKGKYLAFCDGDDYWTDENKLQKQVDFLESHEDYSMCMHNAVKLNYETGEEKRMDTFPEDGAYSQEQQVLAGIGTDFPAFSSVVVRAGLLEDIPGFFFGPKAMDYPIRQYYASCGKVYYFDKPMSVYRVSTPQSYMKQTSASQEFYNNYTLEMIGFFEKFNQYTKEIFSWILENKILSDYFGFCSSIEKEAGLRKASSYGLNLEKVEKVYHCLALDYLDSKIRELDEKTDCLFIYGTSRISAVCRKQLEHAGMGFQGFVVSDGQMKADFMDGKKVYHLGEAAQEFKAPGFILAVQPVNVKAIEGMLKEYGLVHYCKPYVLDDCQDSREGQ